MIEIPESKTISLQAAKTLTGLKISEVITASSPHKFAWYNGDSADYNNILKGREVKTARGHGMFVDICCDEDLYVTICDGTNMRYYSSSEKLPEKYQLIILFDNNSCLVFSVAMYGGIYAYRGDLDNPYHRGSFNSISPLDDAFNESFFTNLIKNVTRDLPAKALLATEQRIPGLGNGVLQDILFNAGIHPKRKKSSLTDSEKDKLFQSIRQTLKNMTDLGGRDTEKDLYGNNGQYKTILSRNTVNEPCPVCGSSIRKEAYLGGAVYYCPSCQKL